MTSKIAPVAKNTTLLIAGDALWCACPCRRVARCASMQCGKATTDR